MIKVVDFLKSPKKKYVKMGTKFFYYNEMGLRERHFYILSICQWELTLLDFDSGVFWFSYEISDEEREKVKFDTNGEVFIPKEWLEKIFMEKAIYSDMYMLEKSKEEAEVYIKKKMINKSVLNRFKLMDLG